MGIRFCPPTTLTGGFSPAANPFEVVLRYSNFSHSSIFRFMYFVPIGCKLAAKDVPGPWLWVGMHFWGPGIFFYENVRPACSICSYWLQDYAEYTCRRAICKQNSIERTQYWQKRLQGQWYMSFTRAAVGAYQAASLY